MAPLKVRWLLLWFLGPSLVVGVGAVWTHRPEALADPLVNLALTSLPVCGYLLWVTLRRGAAWAGPIPFERWKAWLGPCLLLVGGYWFLVLGAEQAWADLWAPLVRAWGGEVQPPLFGPVASPLEGLGVWVVGSFLVPLVEEALFRGALLGLWSRWWGPGAGVAATALVFGFLHGDAQAFKVVLGVGLALLAQRSGSLWVPVTAHALVNLPALGLWVLFGAAGTPSDPRAPGTGPTDPGGALVGAAAFGLVLLGLFVRRMALGDHPGRTPPARARRTWPRWRVRGPRRPGPWGRPRV